jgi:hypothetical protein
LDDPKSKLQEENTMRTSKLIFVCLCLAGLTQLVWSQNKSVEAAHGTHWRGIPGYLDPQTRNFTTKAESSGASSRAGSEEPLSGTEVQFRETFNFSIAALDVPPSAVIFCYASMSTEDSNGNFYETNTTVATRTGSSATCSVPLLANWTLVNPTTDTISAYYEAYSEQSVAVGSYTEVIERYGEAPSLTLPVPANLQTVNNPVSVTM